MAAAHRPLDLRGLDLLWQSPRQGHEASAGDLLQISWDAPAAKLAQRGIEEWEVFLSLDGGRSFRLRITPHLDVQSRSFFWRIPEGLSGEAHLLLRIGDEREEFEHDPGIRFFIRPAAATSRARDLDESVATLGESARPGEPGVVAWVEGDRAGTRLRRRVARRPLEPWLSSAHAGSLPSTFEAPPPSLAAWRAPGSNALRYHLPARSGARTIRPPPGVPIRLLIHRFNE